jgi:nicotinate-nucleotide adenylyltransferase
MRRIGLFGGTFDPPHVGHLALAEAARDRLRLDEVRFIPAGEPPHKRRGGLVPASRRLAMTRLAVRGAHAFTVSTIETRRDGPSFTVDTLRRVRAESPGARLFLLLGTDSLGELVSWREPAEIARLATLVVARRPDGDWQIGGHRFSRAAGRGPARARIVHLDNPELAISSSLIRSRVRAGRSIRYLVPDLVARYIARHRLYRGRT